MSYQASTWDHVHRLLILEREPWTPDHPNRVPWSEVVHLAQTNGIAPLLYATLQRKQLDIPQEVRQALAQAYYQTAAVNTLRFEELSRVLTTLNNRGMPVLLLKGAALAETIYGNLALRPMADLDLMVPREWIEEMPRILGPLEYELQPNQAQHPFAFDARYGGEVTLRKDTPLYSITLDVHWSLLTFWWMTYTTRLDLESMWQAAQPLVLHGVSAWQLCPEDTLLHLCLHAGASHSYAYLPNLVDVDRLITTHGDLNWDRFLQRAHDFRLRVPAYFGLWFTGALLHTPIPERVLADLHPTAQTRSARRWLVTHLVAPRQIILGQKPALSPRSRYLLHLALIDDLPGLLRLLWKLFFPSKGWLVARYAHSRPAARRLARLWHPFQVVGMALAALGRFVQERSSRL